MTTYIIKRMLLMIPTFVVISLIIFLVLNIAPGDPASAQMSSDGAESVSADARESYRIFKEQFHLDKPIMVNTRFSLSKEQVRERIETLADFGRPICAEGQSPPECTPIEVRPSSADLIKAQETLEDWGNFVVPQLYSIATNEDERFDLRRLAANRLATNAQRPLTARFRRDLPVEVRASNQIIAAENNLIRRWTIPSGATEQEFDEFMEAHWIPWFDEAKVRFDYSAADNVKTFFFDTRFAKYWGNLIRLDFGVSAVDRRPVLDTILHKLKYTMTLSFLSILLAYFISIPLGIWSAYNQNTKRDQIMTVFLFVLYSLPSFFTAVLLIQFFAVDRPFKWFPAGGFVGSGSEFMTTVEYVRSVAWHLILPVICLTYGGLAALSRYARTGLLDVIRADYIRTARAKGLSESMVILKHAVRNGMIPILTLVGTLLPALISGSIVIEYVFNIPGLGLYIFESIHANDYNAIMGVLLMSTVLTLIGLLISDISYAIVDPRISFD